MISPLPGAPPVPAELAARLEAALAAKGPSYRPRTHHLDQAGRPRFTNRLVLEASPYLLQHAHNPVDWRPWSDDAFEEARASGRPVFLSIGYSTCHWCHVMERESFEDVDVARLLNERFVPVKVDREERPDVDAIYMTAVQALTGGGGWPMSAFLDADRRPFFAGTYFPPRDGDRGASKGFLTILGEIDQVWRRDPSRVAGAASALSEAVRVAVGTGVAAEPGDLPGDAEIEAAVRLFEEAFDPQFGGVRRAPKFPSSFPIRLLLRWHRRTLEPGALQMATVTLERMAAGGLMDQVGGGFHRYSVDERWLVPHFEKMLYDNALLATAYAEAWQVTKRRDFARVVRQTLDYLLREMCSPEGAFFSATDADSEGEEGKFFVWEEREIRRVLGADADRLLAFHGVTEHGNFEGANVLHVPAPDDDEWEALAPARARLYEAREQRPKPLRDDKILLAWNGLALAALAFAGRILEEPRWIEAARRAARFILERMRPGGRLHRVWKDGRARVPAFLDDHAFLAQGLLELYEATFELPWLEEAVALCDEVEHRFGDPAGGWFATADDHERLIARQKPTHDGAEPSGASVATLNALRLHAFTGRDRWRAIAEGALRHYAPTLRGHPAALTEMLLAVDFRADTPREVVLVWNEGDPAPEEFLAVLGDTFLPNRAILGAAVGDALDALARVAPVADARAAVGGKATAYVCERGQCQLPSINSDKFRDRLTAVRRIKPRGR